MRLFGLIGYPLAQSFSKKYFDEKFRREGLTDCVFSNFPIDEITKFPALIQDNPNLEGMAVTIPYKQSVLSYLDDNKIPTGLNACNCIRISGGRLTGYNTDYIGFEKSFAPLLAEHHTRALVLGNGGATAAVVFVLQQLHIPYKIVSRQLHDDSVLTYEQVDEKCIVEHPIIINTTPVGMYPYTDQYPLIPYSFITGKHLLYDLVYNPGKTLFLQKGEERGAQVKNGEDMLLYQAEENWRIWNK
ncbi:MAG TPA: shikimate dehydrogenase [Chitinophagaceae bacterium]